MLARISNAIANQYSLRLMIVLFAGAGFFFWMFNLSSLPLSTAELGRLSNGEDLFDVRLYYSAQEAFRVMDRYGAKGRAWYLRFLAADFLFLAIYGFAFSLLFTRMAIAIFGPSSSWIKVNLLPLGIALADSVENLCLLILFIVYPERSLLPATIAGIATFSKWTLTVAALICLVTAVVLIIAKRLGLKIYFRSNRPQ